MTKGDVEGFKKKSYCKLSIYESHALNECVSVWGGGESIRDLTSGHLVDPFTVY